MARGRLEDKVRRQVLKTANKRVLPLCARKDREARYGAAAATGGVMQDLPWSPMSSPAGWFNPGQGARNEGAVSLSSVVGTSKD